MNRILFPCLLMLIASCSFPSRKLTNNIETIKANTQDIKAMIMDELPKSTIGYSVSQVQNGKLKNMLQSLNVSQIGITYKTTSKPPSTLKSVLPFLRSDLDSTITISWMKKADDQITFNSLYYFFGTHIPSHQVSNTNNCKDIKINDTIWIQKRIDDYFTVH